MTSEKLPDDVFAAAVQAMLHDPEDPEDPAVIDSLETAHRHYFGGINSAITESGNDCPSTPEAIFGKVSITIGGVILDILVRNTGLEPDKLKILVGSRSETDLSDNLPQKEINPTDNGTFYIK